MLTDAKLQVYLPRDLASKIRRRARKEGKTVAQIVREGLRLYLNRSARDEVREAFAPLDRLVGAFKDDGSGVAENHDQVLGSGPW
ncbi:MAG: CopG family transcriptional regulator [Nitrospirae bacterium]|nr:CopG family transcriptional regulator [Nitrospirota bacterium]